MEVHCYPSQGGFTISVVATPGLRYRLEYYLIGAGGYQESGEISGVIASPKEVIFQPVSVPVVEIGVVSLSLDETITSPPRPGRNQRAAPDRRCVPLAEVEIEKPTDPSTSPWA
jgi:hypothetical protein